MTMFGGQQSPCSSSQPTQLDLCTCSRVSETGMAVDRQIRLASVLVSFSVQSQLTHIDPF
jgi:hypothetical protein